MIVREDACSTMNPDDSPPLPLPPMSLSPLLGVDLGGLRRVPRLRRDRRTARNGAGKAQARARAGRRESR